jgi:hypothetical protein
LEIELRRLKDLHEWQCVHAMSEAFPQHSDGNLNWTRIAQAAYHAGAAKVISEALFKHGT